MSIVHLHVYPYEKIGVFERERGFRINCSGIKAYGYNLQQNIQKKKKTHGKMHMQNHFLFFIFFK